ncbi:MAG: glycosyltransferase family 4 protein [Balneolaceae bacterium]|nr:glycosyltransferase family 4 protein [Balneolaceae bacterium]
MAIALQNEGHIVDVIIGGEGPVVQHYKSHGINVYVIPTLRRDISPLNDIKAFSAIKKKIKLINPDLVSTHSSKAGILGRYAAQKSSIPVIFTAHGWSFTTGKSPIQKFIYKSIEKLATPLSTKIITVSNFDNYLANKYLPVKKEQVLTIHNGMKDVDKSLIATHNRESSIVEIVKIARFDKQKDHSELIEALKDLNNFHLNLIGDGPLIEKTRVLVEQYHMSDRVTFWGRLDCVNDILSKADIFVLISNWEGFPRSTLEAMRAGLPVIVSDVGGASEAIEEGKTGYIVSKGDVKTLQHLLQKLIFDKKKRKEMGNNGRIKYENEFTFGIMYNKTKRLYQEILNAR